MTELAELAFAAEQALEVELVESDWSAVDRMYLEQAADRIRPEQAVVRTRFAGVDRTRLAAVRIHFAGADRIQSVPAADRIHLDSAAGYIRPERAAVHTPFAGADRIRPAAVRTPFAAVDRIQPASFLRWKQGSRRLLFDRIPAADQNRLEQAAVRIRFEADRIHPEAVQNDFEQAADRIRLGVVRIRLAADRIRLEAADRTG